MKSWAVWHNVAICRVETPAIMWLRHINKETEPMYDDFIKLQHQLCSTFHRDNYQRNNIDVVLKKEQHAIVRKNNSWFRTLILDVIERKSHPTTVEVFLLDYGDTITLSASHVIPVTDDQWSSVPYLCRRIKLVGIVPSELTWTANDGTQQLCFKAGKFWSMSAMRLVKEISQLKHVCKFSPSIPFVPTSNAMNVGNLNLEMTSAIREILHGLSCEIKEQESLENLADLLVACKMAVFIQEDLSDRMALAEQESQEADGTLSQDPKSSRNQSVKGLPMISSPPIGIKKGLPTLPTSPPIGIKKGLPTLPRPPMISRPPIEIKEDLPMPPCPPWEISGNIVAKEQEEITNSRPSYVPPFRMEVSSMEAWQPNVTTSPSGGTSFSSLSASNSRDLSDIPIPSESCNPTSSSNSSIFDTTPSNTSPEASIQCGGGRLTGYEKKVKPVRPQEDSPPSVSTSSEESAQKCDSETKNATCNTAANNSISTASQFMHPMFDQATLLRVYNAGKTPVPRPQLIIDEADSSRVLNAQVWEMLKMAQSLVLPLQNFMWPTVVRGRSCVAVERRSHGKTMGAVVPLMSQILDTLPQLRRYAPPNTGPIAIVVCPDWRCVREMTVRMEEFARFANVRVVPVTGGTSASGFEEDRKNMFSVDILVTTPPSLPRLGLFLLDEKPAHDHSVPCVSLRKCSFLVFDNFDVTHQRFPLLTNALLDQWLATARQNDTVKQVVVTSKRWCESVEKVIAQIDRLNPNILISSIFEAAVALQISTRLDYYQSEPLILQAVCDAMSTYGNKKVIVFLDGPQQSERLEELMYTKAISVIKVPSADRPVVKRATALWHGSRSCLLLIEDATIIEYMSTAIKDADVIIHASPPVNSYHLGMRYSYMLDKFQNTEATRVSSHFMLTPEMISRRPQMVPELKRLGVRICDQAQAAYAEGIHRQTVETNAKPLCFSFKCFGQCLETCSLRHYLTSADAPRLLPTGGQVKLEIIEVLSASCVLSRIRSYKSPQGRITILEKAYERLHTRMQNYYQTKANRRSLSNSSVGTLCALERQSWVRAIIVKLDYSVKRTVYTVRAIDEHGLEQRSSDSLYELPRDMANVPALAVEVVLSSIKPVDEDSQFTEYAKHLVSNKLIQETGKPYFTGMVRYALHDTLFLDEIVEVRTIANVPKETSYLVRELLQRKVATPNPSHLRTLCVDESGNQMKFECAADDAWIDHYGCDTNPSAESDAIIDRVQTTGVQASIVDASGRASVNGTNVVQNVLCASDVTANKPVRKIDVLKALMRRSMPNRPTPAVNSNQPKVNCDGVDRIMLQEPSPQVPTIRSPPTICPNGSPPTVPSIGPPPACMTPPRRKSDTDLDDVMSWSNFDYVSVGGASKEAIEYSSSSVYSNSNSIDFKLHETVQVEIKNIFSPKSFFINKWSNVHFLEVLDDKILAATDSLVQFDPDEEELMNCYVAKFIDGFYYRAQLTEIQEGSCAVNFVDHGERMIVSWDKIFACPPSIASEPFQAIHCKLHDIIIPRKLIIEAKNHMTNLADTHKEWLMKPITVEQVDNTLIYSVHLFTVEPTVDMAKSLVEAGLAKISTNLSVQENRNSECQDLRNDRLAHLISDRQTMYSPSETIKEFLREEDGCGTESHHETTTPSLIASLTSALKRRSLYNCPKPANINESANSRGPVEPAVSVCSRRSSRIGSKDRPSVPRPPTNPVKVRHPHTTWKDGYSTIILTFQLCGVENYTFDTSINSVYFATTLNGSEFTFDDHLFSNIVSETAVCSINGREVVVKLDKESNGPWARLLNVTGRIPWLKRDISHLDDSSVCSSVISRKFTSYGRRTPIKKIGGLPAGYSDEDSSDDGSQMSEADDKLFTHG